MLRISYVWCFDRTLSIYVTESPCETQQHQTFEKLFVALKFSVVIGCNRAISMKNAQLLIFMKSKKVLTSLVALSSRWSDGSLSMHLGSEIFDVHKQPLTGDFNHLFIRQGTGLQGQAVFRTKLSFRPHSTESFTHQKMTR